jgi:hypothetical protein
MIASAGGTTEAHSARRSTPAIRASPLIRAARSVSAARTGTADTRSWTVTWATLTSPSAGSTLRI